MIALQKREKAITLLYYEDESKTKSTVCFNVNKTNPKISRKSIGKECTHPLGTCTLY